LTAFSFCRYEDDVACTRMIIAFNWLSILAGVAVLVERTGLPAVLEVHTHELLRAANRTKLRSATSEVFHTPFAILDDECLDNRGAQSHRRLSICNALDSREI
jgi:hypothetical protein